jgi:hypothetical protein
MTAGRDKLRDGDELVQSPANPSTQVDKDDLNPDDESAEGFPTRENRNPGHREQQRRVTRRSDENDDDNI